ncbi:oligopeptide ABC transporter permease [Aerococcus sp. 1KP-2016]|uniref:oligopeptide ABC transporter permease n=1 Tax=Aerococcus sp. 1KP-2016 TaxID=1981982 RepID=UPI000B995736|nr:oligopeptide ABC transporter permease [Aerococcus sp. 1KP-2016]OYQ66515.1 peptide ABC transporter permease [Aerococcus sp. 1KP-2016]
MWKTILRRVILMLPQILILSVLVFIVARFMPGDPFTGLITPEMDPSTIEALRERAGLNDPIIVQYFNWLKNALQGDFGMSYTYKVPVATLIGDRAINTVFLSLLSLIFTYIIALPLGILAGRYANSAFDKGVVLYNFISYAIPTFVLALLMVWFFGYELQWFPTNGSVSTGVTEGTLSYYWNRIYHMILPAITYALLGTTGIIQYLRSEVIDAKQQDYVKTARSKGVPENMVYNRHIFRNSILPVASTFGYEITGLIGGSVFIEQIFAYPGMGQLFIQSIYSRDYSVITALVLLFGITTIVGTLLSDIIMTIVDPRIRIQ